MKKSNLILSVFCTSLSFLALSASAETCTTNSHNIRFVSNNTDVDQATQDVLSQCTSASVTDNNECSTNLSCNFGNQTYYPSNTAVCTSSSRGIGFQTLGLPSQLDTLISSLVQQCTSTSITDNNECSANVSCEDLYQSHLPYPNFQTTCRTNSKNIPFEQSGASNTISTIVNTLVQSCTSNAVTDNNECSANISCGPSGPGFPPNGPNGPGGPGFPPNGPGNPNGPGHPPGGPGFPPNGPHPMTCSTFSHNIPFQAQGSSDQVDTLTSQVLSACTSNPVTNNTECSQNLSCR